MATDKLIEEVRVKARHALNGEKPDGRSEKLAIIFYEAGEGDLLQSICKEEKQKYARSKNPFQHLQISNQ